jgi:hypothetical protein
MSGEHYRENPYQTPKINYIKNRKKKTERRKEKLIQISTQ